MAPPPPVKLHLRSLTQKTKKHEKKCFHQNFTFDDLTTSPIDHIKLLHQFSFSFKRGVFINDGQFCEELLGVIRDTLSCSCCPRRYWNYHLVFFKSISIYYETHTHKTHIYLFYPNSFYSSSKLQNTELEVHPSSEA